VSRYRFIAAEKANYPVSLLCRVLGVSRQAFYAWHDRGPSARERADQQLLERITQIHRDSRGTYGAPRVHAELREDYGIRCGRKRVARLMRTHGLVGCHRRRRRGLTRPDPKATPAPDLVGRLFDPGAPDRTWYADISYIPTQEGWLYLAAILDGYSRKVVGWAMADHLRAELALDALQMALGRRQPARGLIHHSDRGSQGGFNWSSQHLHSEELRCGNGDSEGRVWRGGRRCGRLVGRRWRGVRIGSGSGRRSRAGCRARTPRCRAACRRLWGRGGSARVAACRRSVWPRCRAATCRSRNGKRSRS
jgi:putative transposase